VLFYDIFYDLTLKIRPKLTPFCCSNKHRRKSISKRAYRRAKNASKRYAIAAPAQTPTPMPIKFAFLIAATKFTRSFSSSPNSAASSPETKF